MIICKSLTFHILFWIQFIWLFFNIFEHNVRVHACVFLIPFIWFAKQASERERASKYTRSRISFHSKQRRERGKNHLHPAINAITQAKLTSYQKIRIHTHTSHFIHSNAMCECVCLSAEIHLMRFSMVSSWIPNIQRYLFVCWVRAICTNYILCYKSFIGVKAKKSDLEWTEQKKIKPKLEEKTIHTKY